jgi:N-sulfoglucosamine sulfohydrolase
MNKSSIPLILFLALILQGHRPVEPPSRPNILWITSEDNSPLLGCYGDSFATTSNLDRLAARGFLYTHAYANAPVCAPARNTIITGVYANSGGHQHMRSTYRKSASVRFLPEFLREAGYYCTNNSKEDYNIDPGQTKGIWDESGITGHYKNRAAGQPFFAVFNSTISHESSLHTTIPADQLRHKPELVRLPPYHPDTPEIRHDWAQYYDKIEDLDAWVGGILRELEELGEADNTIIFYYGDHGGVLARSKRFLYETGTRVPFIAVIPEKYKDLFPAPAPGSRVDRLISFVDLAPTLLSITGCRIPDYMQGKAFLGSATTADPEYVYMFRDRMDERIDMSRALRDGRYRYIRNYMPHRIYGQYLEYLWRAPSVRSWEAACRSGECNEIQRRFWGTKPSEELYDTQSDPWEVKNLAADPDYATVLRRMRIAARDWMEEIRDTGFLPEPELSVLAGPEGAYDYMRQAVIDLPRLIEAADRATLPGAAGQEELLGMLRSGDAALSFWGATGLLLHSREGSIPAGELRNIALNAAPSASITVAELLYRLGDPEGGRKRLIHATSDGHAMVRNQALNAIDAMDDNSAGVQEAVIALVQRATTIDRSQYDLRSARRLLEKWGVDPTRYGINKDW